MPTVATVIDYGMSNILSLRRALEHCGARVNITADADDIGEAEMLILPGVGSFAQGMRNLAERDLVEPTRQFAAGGRPLLGICLGMQMLLESGSEGEASEGLGLIPGNVVSLPARRADGGVNRVPHIAWNNLLPPEPTSWDDTIFAGTSPGMSTYFVHSFSASPSAPQDILATTPFGDGTFVSAISRENVVGVQFHPEKSGAVGLTILRTFLGG